MRKVLLFLAVFSVGLALIWVGMRLSDGQGIETTNGSRPLETRPPTTGPADAGSAETGLPAAEIQDLAPARLHGFQKLDSYAPSTGGVERRRDRHLEGIFEAQDAAYREYLVTDLKIQIFDPVSGDLLQEIRSPRGRVTVAGDRIEDLHIGDDGHVILEEVVIERYGDGPLDPVTITAPMLEGWLDRDSFRSVGDGLVTIVGTGLDASGRGLVLEGTTGVMTLERGGEVDFDLGQQGVAHFKTTGDGPLIIERVGVAGEGAVQVTAREGASLVIEGEERSQVDARTLELFGHIRDGRFIAERGRAQGEVVVLKGEGRFEGDSARLEMDDEGAFEKVVLEDQPSAHVELIDEDGESVPLDAEGEGPLTVRMDTGEMHFELLGPGKITAPTRDLTIEFDGYLQATTDQARTRTVIEVRDRVRVSQGAGSRLDTEKLDGVFVADAVGTLDLFCSGVTHVSGRDSRGDLLVVDIEELAQIEVRGETWAIPLAVGVRMRSVGEQPFRATAAILSDLDVAKRTFKAEGDVTWVGVFGAGGAHRAEATEDGTLHLVGTPEAPAHFDVLPGRAALEEDDAARRYESARLEALEIDLAETWAEGRGAVVATVNGFDRKYSLNASYVLLKTEPPSEPDAPTSFHIEARDVDQLEAVDLQATTKVRCQTLHVDGLLRKDASGDAPEDMQPWALVATGAVRLDHEGQIEIHGTGERLEMKGGGEGRLTTGEGQRVHVWGLVPGSLLPLDLTATWFRWTVREFEAESPRMTLESALFSTASESVQGQDSDQESGQENGQENGQESGQENGQAPGPGQDDGQDLGQGQDQGPDQDQDQDQGQGQMNLTADHFLADDLGLTFKGSVTLRGVDEEGIPILVETESLRLAGDFGDDLQVRGWGGSIESFEARGGFVMVYGGLGLARGRRLLAMRERAIMEGVPGEPAIVDMGQVAIESTYIDVDLVNFLLTSNRGVLRAPEGVGSWALEYSAIRHQVVDDRTMIIVVSPHFVTTDSEARADFAAAWIHEEAWRQRGQEMLGLTPRSLDEEAAPIVPVPKLPEQDLVENVFRRLSEGELAQFLRSAYLEGNVETTEYGQTTSRADSIYLDMENRVGWLKGATLSASMELTSGRRERVRVAADKILTAADGSLRADKATLTTSIMDDPSYVIEVGKLVLAPRVDGGWRFSARKNRLRLRNGLQLPLPTLGNIALDESGGFIGFSDEEDNVRRVDYLKLGSSARFGTSIGTAFRHDLGRVGRWAGSALGFKPDEVRGKWYTEGSWLSDRGALLGLGLELSESGRNKSQEEEFWFNIYAQGIADDGEDKGLVRVPVDERDTLRTWIHARGRYPFSDDHWIDVAFTTQSDPGVQSEFYERQFLRFEERDNFVHWRKASGDNYFDASAKVRVDSYRTELEERPSAGAYTGESRIGKLGKFDVLYGANFDVDNLRRREGDLRFEDPFLDIFGDPDGLGDRSVLRLDTSHRLSMPYRSGLAGITATPWLEGRFTSWDQGLDENDSPSRAALLGGLELSTTLLKTSGTGFIHTLTPTLTYRNDLAIDESGGQHVRFDTVDDPLDGEEIGVGLRGRWTKPGKRESFDAELKAVRRHDRATGLADLEQFAALARWRSQIGNVPIAVLYDGRFDFESSRTIYSRGTFAFQPSEPLIFQFSHSRGLDADLQPLFEAATIGARIRLDPKWELEFVNQISILNGGRLHNRIIVRRFGADFLLELEFEDRTGEGVAFRINLLPLFLWKPEPFGILGR